MQLVRFPLYTEKDHKLIGYWLLKPPDDKCSRFALSYKLGKDEHRRFTFSSSAKAVVAFYASAVNYWENQIAQLEREIHSLPTVEYRRNGFRAGWLSRTRQTLEAAKTRVKAAFQENLFRQLEKLRNCGWPTPGLPDLPWMTLNAVKAAATLWIRAGGDSPVPSTGGVSGSDSKVAQANSWKGGKDFEKPSASYTSHYLGGNPFLGTPEVLRPRRAEESATQGGGNVYRFGEGIRTIPRVGSATIPSDRSPKCTGAEDLEAHSDGSRDTCSSTSSAGGTSETYLKIQAALGLGKNKSGDGAGDGDQGTVCERVPCPLSEAPPQLVSSSESEPARMAVSREEGDPSKSLESGADAQRDRQAAEHVSQADIEHNPAS